MLPSHYKQNNELLLLFEKFANLASFLQNYYFSSSLQLILFTLLPLSFNGCTLFIFIFCLGFLVKVVAPAKRYVTVDLTKKPNSTGLKSNQMSLG